MRGARRKIVSSVSGCDAPTDVHSAGIGLQGANCGVFIPEAKHNDMTAEQSAFPVESRKILGIAVGDKVRYCVCTVVTECATDNLNYFATSKVYARSKGQLVSSCSLILVGVKPFK